MDKVPNGKRPRGDEEPAGNKKRQTRHLGGILQTLTERTAAQLEEGRPRKSTASSAPRPPVIASPARQAYVEDAPEEVEEGTPSTQAHREGGAEVVDLTSDGSQETLGATAPMAPGVPGPASAVPTNNVSILGGKLQGTPTEVAAKAIHKYGTKFRQQADVCNKRAGRDDIIVHERLVAVVRLLEQARNLASLGGIHNRHGEDALITAHNMLVKEHKFHTKVMEQIQELPVRAGYRKDTLARQTVRVSNMEAAMNFCDKLVTDIVGLPLAVKLTRVT